MSLSGMSLSFDFGSQTLDLVSAKTCFLDSVLSNFFLEESSTRFHRLEILFPDFLPFLTLNEDSEIVSGIVFVGRGIESCFGFSTLARADFRLNFDVVLLELLFKPGEFFCVFKFELFGDLV